MVPDFIVNLARNLIIASCAMRQRTPDTEATNLNGCIEKGKLVEKIIVIEAKCGMDMAARSHPSAFAILEDAQWLKALKRDHA